MNIPAQCTYGDVRITKLSFDDAVATLEGALKAEGFGVLCMIDIRAKLKEKLGVDFPPYLILGACNPPLAHRALGQDVNLGLLRLQLPRWEQFDQLNPQSSGYSSAADSHVHQIGSASTHQPNGRRSSAERGR